VWSIQPGSAAIRRNVGGASRSTLSNGLVAYWKLDEASGNRADSVGGNTLTDNNTVTQNPGKVGNAGQFTSANSEYLSIADNAALSMGDFDFEITCWVYADTLTLSTILAKGHLDGTATEEYAIWYNSNRFRWTVSNGTTQDDAVANTFGTPSTATWYFLDCYHDSMNNLIGISINNGAFNTTAHSAGSFDSANALRIGVTSNGNYYWNGRIDEVKFWKRLLTASERAEDYTNGLAGRALI